MASTSFWTQERGIGFLPVFYNTINFARYPLTLYPAVLRFMMTFILPYAFMAFYPAAGLLRAEYALFAWLTLPVGLVVFGLGLLIWQRGLLRYEGIGS